MMKRLFMLLSLALMVGAAMALSGVAQAASPTAKCKAAAGLVDPSLYNFIVGNNKKADNFSLKGTEGADVFCGFGGNDVLGIIAEGDIFIAGDGIENVGTNNGTFYGGAGDDRLSYNSGTGTFDGGAGIDSVIENYGTFNGEADVDFVYYNYATFYGGAGADYVDYNYAGGTFYGGDGTDYITNPDPADSPGTFNQDAL
jgi:Ca2+-binding RTX toxin-like protein